MGNRSRQTESNRTRGSFPLASLALIVTVFAAALACTDLGRWDQQVAWVKENWPWRIAAIFGGVAMFGGMIGVVHLVFLPTHGRVRWVAPLAGILAGELGALILIAPGPLWRTLFAIIVLLGTTILLRLGAE